MACCIGIRKTKLSPSRVKIKLVVMISIGGWGLIDCSGEVRMRSGCANRSADKIAQVGLGGWKGMCGAVTCPAL